MSGISNRLRASVVPAVIILGLLSGCASTHTPSDPIEPVNRAVYHFNDTVDHVLLKPAAEIYSSVLPSFARSGVANFFSNINDVPVALNNLLQGKIENAASDAGRVVVNTTIGLLGLLDVATNFGLEKHNEDFGQTLGYWGVSDGPFLMLPLLGPSNLRDAVGRVVDYKADLVAYVDPTRDRNILQGARAVSQRAGLLEASKILEAAALDPYEFLRDAYIQRRRNLVYDGSPPRERNNDSEIRARPRAEAPDKSPSPGSLASANIRAPSKAETLTGETSAQSAPPKRVIRVWLP
jgi:phospholipid-binding lipoprotein MlaA